MSYRFDGGGRPRSRVRVDGMPPVFVEPSRFLRGGSGDNVDHICRCSRHGENPLPRGGRRATIMSRTEVSPDGVENVGSVLSKAAPPVVAGHRAEFEKHVDKALDESAVHRGPRLAVDEECSSLLASEPRSPREEVGGSVELASGAASNESGAPSSRADCGEPGATAPPKSPTWHRNA